MPNDGESLHVGHFCDLHYSTERLVEADRCFGFAVEDAVARGCHVGIVSGDATDHRLDAHTPALRVLAERIHALSGHMPVLMLQGTVSHEPPGTLDLFRLIGSRHPVYVADRIHQVALVGSTFLPSAGPLFTVEELRDRPTPWWRSWGAPDALSVTPDGRAQPLQAPQLSRMDSACPSRPGRGSVRSGS